MDRTLDGARHYTDAQLRELALGQLLPEFAEAVCTHLEVCGQCCSRYEAIELAARKADGFLADLRVAAEATQGLGHPGYSVPLADGSDNAATARFRILGEHAKGGLGCVFRARDEHFGRDVAVKSLRADLASSDAARLRFEREAVVTARLEHPGVVPVYGMQVDAEGQMQYAMKFIRGRSLAVAIGEFHQRKFGRTGDEQADGAGQVKADSASFTSLEFRKLLQQLVTVCQTMEFAHSRGIVHRDLKPQNIMLGDYGETQVVDWGLAKQVVDPNSPHAADTSNPDETLPEGYEAVSAPHPNLTRANSAPGTPAYMSPEQAGLLPHPVGAASDIYSLGATLCSLLTGKAPVPVRDRTMVSHKTEDQQLVPAFVTAIPRDLGAICRKATAIAPADRYGSAREFGEDITRYLADEPVKAWREPLRDRTRRWIRRHLMAVLTSTTALLVALVAGLYWSARQTQLQTQLKYETVANGAWRVGDAVAAENNLARAINAGHADRTRLELERLKAFIAMKSPDRALTLARQLSARDDLATLESQVALWHGDAQILAGHTDAGKRHIQRALNNGLPPEDKAYAQAMLATSTVKAADHLREAVSTDPHHVAALEQLLVLLIWRGEREESRERLKVVGQYLPNWPQTPVFLSWLNALEGKPYQAEIDAARAYFDESNVDRLSNICQRMSEFRTAVPGWAGSSFQMAETSLVALLDDVVDSSHREGEHQLLYRAPPALVDELTIIRRPLLATDAEEIARAGLALSAAKPQSLRDFLLGLVETNPYLSLSKQQDYGAAAQAAFKAEKAFLSAASGPALVPELISAAWYSAAMSAQGRQMALARAGAEREFVAMPEAVANARKYLHTSATVPPLTARYMSDLADMAGELELARLGMQRSVQGWASLLDAETDETQRANIRTELHETRLALADIKLRLENHAAALKIIELVLDDSPDDTKALAARKATLESIEEYLRTKRSEEASPK